MEIPNESRIMKKTIKHWSMSNEENKWLIKVLKDLSMLSEAQWIMEIYNDLMILI